MRSFSQAVSPTRIATALGIAALLASSGKAFKDAFNDELIDSISLHLSRAWADFDTDHFERLAKDGLGELELKARAAHIGGALLATLPTDFEVRCDHHRAQPRSRRRGGDFCGRHGR